MLRRQHNPTFYFGLWSTWHHTDKINNKFGYRVIYNGQVGIGALGSFFIQLNIDLFLFFFLFCHCLYLKRKGQKLTGGYTVCFGPFNIQLVFILKLKLLFTSHNLIVFFLRTNNDTIVIPHTCSCRNLMTYNYILL